MNEQAKKELLELEKQEAKESEGALNVSPFKQRFSDAAWFKLLKDQYLLLIGAGGIGSWVAFALSRIGCSMSIYDMDIVEPHNLGGQLYNTEHIGANKAEVTKTLCQQFSGNENTIEVFGKYLPESPSNEIVICAFDNMAGRKTAYENWKALLEEDPENKENYILIDGRLLAEQYQVFTVTHNRLKEYEKTLFSDSEVEEVLCTLKATTHCSMGIASEIIGVLTNFFANKKYGGDLCEVPFLIEKSIPSLTYEVRDYWELEENKNLKKEENASEKEEAGTESTVQSLAG